MVSLAGGIRSIPIVPVAVRTLRHSFCTRLILADVTIRTVQEVVGHQDLKMIAAVYAHSKGRQRSQRRAGQALNPSTGLRCNLTCDPRSLVTNLFVARQQPAPNVSRHAQLTHVLNAG